MSYSQLIAEDIPVIELQNTGDEILAIMEKSGLEQLPVVNNGLYEGIIKEEIIFDWNNELDNLTQHQSNLLLAQGDYNAHPYQWAKIMSDAKLQILPIVNQDKEYQGSVTTAAMIDFLLLTHSVREEGSIIILQVDINNYSLSEIARLAESNNIIILSSGMHMLQETGKILITLKVNKIDVQALLASLERFDYHVLEVFGAEDNKEVFLDRYNLLLKYMNM